MDTTQHHTRVASFAALVETKVRTLSLPDSEIPSAEEVRAWIACAFRETRAGVTFRRTWPRNHAPGMPGAEAFWRLLKWQLSPGSLGGLFTARYRCPDRGTFDRATTLATVCAVLSGRETASDRWARAVGRSL